MDVRLSSALRIAAYSLAITCGMAASYFAILHHLSPDWAAHSPASCIPHGCFCERDHLSRLVRQPANTVSSFSFFYLGISVWLFSRQKRTWSVMRRAHAYLFAVVAVIIGLGSVFFHSSLSITGQFFDVVGMYGLASFLVAYAVYRARGRSDQQFLLLFAGLVGALSLSLILWPETRRYLFAIVLIIGIAAEIAYHRGDTGVEKRYFYSGLSLFALAYGLWFLDNSKILCSPDSVLQGHAVWHVAGAVSMLLLLVYYMTEGDRDGQT